VAFTAAATGGTPSSYTATSTPGGFTASGAGSPLTVTGLQSATSYTFAVTGTNATATGAASAASSSITATTVPQAPTIGTATAGNGTASVTFTPGATGGASVSTYTVTSSSGASNTGASSPIVVTETAVGTRTYTVTATNANGTSAASSASNSLVFAVPGAPTIGTATAGNLTASITFTAGTTGNSTITGYTVTSSSGRTNTGASSPIVVTEVAAGTYTYTVTATNGFGTGSASSASNSLTFGVPAAPTVSSFTDGGTGTSGTLAFSLNSSNNSTITTVKWSIDNVTYTSAGTTTSPISLTGLTPGAKTFYLKATNALGDSTAGSVAGTVIQPTAYESIASSVLSADAANITFSSISSAYVSLQLRVSVIGTNDRELRLRMNNDSTATAYSNNAFWVTNNSTSLNRTQSTNSILISRIPAINLGDSATTVHTGVIDIFDYASTSKNKTLRGYAGFYIANVTGGQGGMFNGAYYSLSAVNSLVIFSGANLRAGTIVALYGIKG
jgi:hypothetical protein